MSSRKEKRNSVGNSPLSSPLFFSFLFLFFPLAPFSPQNYIQTRRFQLTQMQSLKRTRSTSPSNSSHPKRRVPPSYLPDLLHHSQQQRDWVSLTQGLHLVTPPLTSTSTPHSQIDEDEDMDMMSTSPPPPSLFNHLKGLDNSSFIPHPQPPTFLYQHQQQHFQDQIERSPLLVPPSSPIPLYQSLSMARQLSSSSSTSSSTSSSSSYSFTDPRPRPQQQYHHQHQPAFQMGFKQDCEKCRMRVPGHYAHSNVGRGKDGSGSANGGMAVEG